MHGSLHRNESCLNSGYQTYKHYFHFGYLPSTLPFSEFQFREVTRLAFFRQAFSRTNLFSDQKISKSHLSHQIFLKSHLLLIPLHFEHSLTSSLVYCFSFTYHWSFFVVRQVVLAGVFIATFGYVLNPHVIISVRVSLFELHRKCLEFCWKNRSCWQSSWPLANFLSLMVELRIFAKSCLISNSLIISPKPLFICPI